VDRAQGERLAVRWRDRGRYRSKKFRNEDDAVRFKQTVEEVRLPGTDARVDEQGYFWARRPGGTSPRTLRTRSRSTPRRWSRRTRTWRTQHAALYRRIIRAWIEGTDVGRADVRYITPEVIERWWASLPTGMRSATSR
jgi:hypothetical protein